MVKTEEPRRAGGATTTVDLRAMEVCLAAVTPARAGTVKPATAAMAPRVRFGIWASEISPMDEISIFRHLANLAHRVRARGRRGRMR